MSKIYADSSISSQLIELGRNFIAMLKDMLNMAVAESKLAQKSLKVILGLLAAIIVFGFSAWLCFLGAVISWLSTLGLQMGISFCIVGLLNLFIVIGMVFSLRCYQRNLTFSKTKKHLFSVKKESDGSIKSKNSSV